MSLLWKIPLKGEEAGQFLFSKHSSSQATCNVCQIFGQLSHFFVDEEGFNDEQVSSAMIDLKSYTKQKRIDPEADPLQYWKTMRKVLLSWLKSRSAINRHLQLSNRANNFFQWQEISMTTEDPI
uniref:Uncharacterized protein n=1 Tax=Ditylenchus dipsaci TaxID=166011 RepID=A0A915EG20_9BILA